MGKIIEDKEAKKTKRCPYCRKTLIYLDNRHFNRCKEYQEHEKKIELEKKRKPQTSIDQFFEIIERQAYPIDVIYPNDWNVNSMKTEDFKNLKESIRITNGEYLKKVPIQIRKIKDDYYEIIDGEHRWKASKELGFTHIPAIIEENVNLEETRTLNVIQSSNRGKIDHFKFSKLLNQEYLDENGKKKCTQQQLADRFGIQVGRIKHIIHIYPKLKNLLKSAPAHFFENAHLEELAKVKNELLREKLIDQSIKEKLTRKEIRIHATKLNKISKFLDNEFIQKTRECILTIFTGNFLFTHSYNDFIEKVFELIVDNNHKDIIIKYTRDFALHSNIAREFKEKYIKENKTYTNWYNTYRSTSESRIASKMTWDFFKKYYNGKVCCWRCGKEIQSFNDYVDHHEEYEFKDDMLFFVFSDGDQKIFPSHNNKNCHPKGTSKNWKNKEV
jgi:ParB/RepB/Spo0J family partition protein